MLQACKWQICSSMCLGVMKVGNMEGISVFQAGTCLSTSDQLVTSGGRVLTVVGVESDLENSLALALKGVGLIDFQGCHYRKDIAHRGINFLRRSVWQH